jgi:hypothetical protein
MAGINEMKKNSIVCRSSSSGVGSEIWHGHQPGEQLVAALNKGLSAWRADNGIAKQHRRTARTSPYK